MTLSAKSLLSLCAMDIMSDHVVMIPREMSLQGAARMLTRAGITGAPVVDANGHCIGVLSTTDFMHWVENERTPARPKPTGEPMCSAWQIPDGVFEPGCRAEDFMTRDPVLVEPHAKFGELARMMMDAHIHRVIVVDKMTQRPLGIVSSMDILAAVARAESVEEPATEYAMAGATH